MWKIMVKLLHCVLSSLLNHNLLLNLLLLLHQSISYNVNVVNNAMMFVSSGQALHVLQTKSVLRFCLLK